MSDEAFVAVTKTLSEIQFLASQFLKRTAYRLDRAILSSHLRPSLIVLSTIVVTLSVLLALRAFSLLLKISTHLNIPVIECEASRADLKTLFFSIARELPFVKSLIAKEKKKLQDHLNSDKAKFLQNEKPMTSLPVEGWSATTVLHHLKERNQRNVEISQKSSKVSGTVYLAGQELETLLCDVYSMHSLANPLHPDVFPSVRQMEAEVIGICCDLMNSKKSAKNLCGTMTSGGSESILSAVKASRDYMRDVRGIKNPEMIVAESAHAAFHKAAEYFAVKIVVLRVDKGYRLAARDVYNAINGNTILVAASAPGFPHGIVDPIEEIAQVAQSNGVLFHVDCCLGGFFLPFAKKLGANVPAFDFSVKGVTSISIDTHKYGMSHKGTSVVLYRSPSLRRYQYTAVSDWTGGMYISPGFAGSRSGALIATAWASLLYLGESGYLEATRQIMGAVSTFKTKLKGIPDLEIVGEPVGSVAAIKLKTKPERIYQVNDFMTQRGWHLSPLQFPPALHISFTLRHIEAVDRLVEDITEAVDSLRTGDPSKGGTASIYGTACSVPDRRIVKDLLVAYQDCMLSP